MFWLVFKSTGCLLFFFYPVFFFLPLHPPCPSQWYLWDLWVIEADRQCGYSRSVRLWTSELNFGFSLHTSTWPGARCLTWLSLFVAANLSSRTAKKSSDRSGSKHVVGVLCHSPSLHSCSSSRLWWVLLSSYSQWLPINIPAVSIFLQFQFWKLDSFLRKEMSMQIILAIFCLI